MNESSNSLDRQNMDGLIQFAAKAETTSQLQSYWFNRYSEAVKNNLFNISKSTISNLLQADEVQKPITPFASINITKHIDNNAGNYVLNESKLQSTLDVVVRLLDSVLDSVNFNTEAKFLVDEYRKVGISITDFEEYLKIKNGEKAYEIDYIGSLISNGCYRSSESLAEEKGVCQGWEMINKIIKPLSFEYWFNIDTGEIKSGKEISTEFNVNSIKNSKFEIVPRRNSHLLLLSDGVEWKEWNDRENIFNIKPIDFVSNETQANNQNDQVKESESRKSIPVTKIEEEITVEGQNLNDIPQFEIPQENEDLNHSNSFEGGIDETKDNDEVLDSLTNSSLGGISMDNNIEYNNSNDADEVNPEMVDLDDLISNINNDSIKQQELFNPSINKIDEKLIAQEENKMQNEEMEKQEGEINPVANQEKKSVGFISKLFSNPFTKNEEEKPVPSIDKEEVKLDTQIEDNIEPIIEPAIEPNIEMQIESDLKDEAIENMENIEPVDLNVNNIINEMPAEKTKDEFTAIETNEEEAHAFSVGELVQVTDLGHPKYNQYLQVIEVNDHELVLLDGNDMEGSETTANISQVTAASIEQVLGQLNNRKPIVKEEISEASLANIEMNSNQEIGLDTNPKEQNSTGLNIKVLLFTGNNEVLVKQKNGRVSLPMISISEDESDIEKAIINVLKEQYGVVNISDLSDSGVYTDYVDNKEYVGYFGFISQKELLNPEIRYINIVDAYNKSSDVTSILDSMSDTEKEVIENAIQEAEDKNYEHVEELIPEIDDEINEEEKMLEEVSKTAIPQLNEYRTPNFDYNYMNSTIPVNNQAINNIPMQNEENIQIQEQPKKINMTITEPKQSENSTVTYFPQNTNPNLNTANNNHMLYQSTSKTASYSKFSVLVKQIINTAEFGAIVLHIHYDTSGPKVLTVELPQLINDSVLQILRTYINLINASMIRGSDLSSTVSLIQDQLELAGETDSVSEVVDIILKGINALPKSIQEFNSTRVLALDVETSRNIVKTGIDPLKALAEKYINN